MWRTIAGVVAVGALFVAWRFVALPSCGGDDQQEVGHATVGDAMRAGPKNAVFDAAPPIDSNEIAPSTIEDALVHVMYPDDVVCFARELLASDGPPFIDPRLERISDKLTSGPFAAFTNWQYRAVTRFEGTADRAALITKGTLAIYVSELDDRRVHMRVVIVREDGAVRQDTKLIIDLSDPTLVGFEYDPLGVTVVLWLECVMG